MLTHKAKYAIKALAYLAGKEGVSRTKDIAEEAHIPKKFLESILIDLKRHSLVASQQGPTGGYALLKKPEDITIAEVYRIFEGPVALVPCASEKFYRPCGDCIDVEGCKVRLAMQYIRSETLRAMNAITIDKLADSEAFIVLNG